MASGHLKVTATGSGETCGMMRVKLYAEMVSRWKYIQMEGNPKALSYGLVCVGSCSNFGFAAFLCLT